MTKQEFVRSRYEAYLHYWARVGLGLGIPVILSLSLLDRWITPEHFQVFLGYRIATAAGMLALLGLNRLRVHGDYQSLLGLVAGAMVSTMLALMVARLGGHRSVYFAGFILVLVFVCSFLPLRLGYGVTAAVLVHAFYLGPILVYDTVTDPAFFAAANVLILMCAGSMLVLQNLGFRRLLKEFELQYELEQQRSGLEVQVQARTAELTRLVQDLDRTGASLRALIQAAPVSIVALDTEQKVTLWNPAAERTFGWTAAEVLGKPNPLITASEEPALAANLERLRRGETITDQLVERRTKSGVPVTLLLSAAPLRGTDGEIAGYMSVLADVTEQRKLEGEILEARDEWEESFNTINDAITIHDRAFNIVRANKAAIELLRLSPQALEGAKCHRVYHGSACPPVGCPSCSALATGKTTVTEIYEPHLQKHLEIKALPRLDREGRLIGVVHVVRDLSEANRLKAQLFQAQKMEAVGQLASGVAHDFNNILSAITCFADLLRLRLLAGDEQSRAYVDQVLVAAERAAALTQSLLAFGRKQVVSLKPVELNGIVHNLQKLLVRLIGEDVELQTRLSATDLIVVADAGLIEQVLLNLATNARDAMPRGGRITIATEAFEMDDRFVAARGFGKPGAYALLSFSDSGQGMDAATREKIFEPFFTTKEPGKGTGLGLAMVYGTVKQHDGYIAVESEPGKGARFLIWIPRRVVALAAPESGWQAPAPRGGGETILVAEDDPVLRELARQILEGNGYRVLTAGDGEEAVRLFREDAGTVALLLLDIVMPRKSGQEASEEIRRLRPSVRTLYMSGYAREAGTSGERLEPGVNLLGKPLSPASLLQAVRRCLDAPAEPG